MGIKLCKSLKQVLHLQKAYNFHHSYRNGHLIGNPCIFRLCHRFDMWQSPSFFSLQLQDNYYVLYMILLGTILETNLARKASQ